MRPALRDRSLHPLSRPADGTAITPAAAPLGPPLLSSAGALGARLGSRVLARCPDPRRERRSGPHGRARAAGGVARPRSGRFSSSSRSAERGRAGAGSTSVPPPVQPLPPALGTWLLRPPQPRGNRRRGGNRFPVRPEETLAYVKGSPKHNCLAHGTGRPPSLRPRSACLSILHQQVLSLALGEGQFPSSAVLSV